MLKKISAFLLSVTMVLSLFASSFSSLAAAEDITLPESVYVEEEVTKDISLSDMKLVYFNVNNKASAIFKQQDFKDHIQPSTVLTDGEQVIFGNDDMKNASGFESTSGKYEGAWLAFYPLEADQTLKSFSYNVKLYGNGENVYIPFVNPTSDGLKINRLSMPSNSEIGRRDLYSQVICGTTVTDTVLSGFGDSPSGDYSGTGDSTGFLEGVDYVPGTNGINIFDNHFGNSAHNVVLDYTTDGFVKTKIIDLTNGSYCTKDYVNGLNKNYPIAVGQNKNDGGTYTCYADMKITYTEKVDITGEVKEFAADNPFALAIKNNDNFSNITEADKAKATELKAAYEASDAYLQTALETYGYYNAANVNSIINGGVVTDEAYVPTLVSATIRASGTQDIRFKATISNEVIAGRTVEEFGMIIADYRNINPTFTINDLTYNSKSDKVIVAKKTGADNGCLGQTFYVNIGGLDTNTYGVPFIARAYVKYDNGQVCYSTNTTTDPVGNHVARTGVVNGCAVRSVISIAKAMIVALSEKFPEEVSTVAIVSEGQITDYVDENGNPAKSPSDNGERLFELISKHKNDLEN